MLDSVVADTRANSAHTAVCPAAGATAYCTAYWAIGAVVVDGAVQVSVTLASPAVSCVIVGIASGVAVVQLVV